MFDAHFHLPVAPIVAEGICCTSKSEEWAIVKTLSPQLHPSIGLLPEHLSEENRELFFQAWDKSWIGEVGLDRRYPDVNAQARFLEEVLLKAGERVVSLHCVREDGLLLSLLQPSVKTIWHGFTGSAETARLAVQKGCVISIGETVERTKLWSHMKELRDLPFLLESDAEENLNYQEHFTSHCNAVATAMGYSVEELEAHIDATRSILEN